MTRAAVRHAVHKGKTSMRCRAYRPLKTLLPALLLACTGWAAPAYCAYDWIFAKEAGDLTVITEEDQGSAGEYDTYRIVIRPPGAGAEDIPMLLCLPKAAQPPHPCVVLLHGHGGAKEGPIGLMATALAQAGIAALAYDLPDHGERNTGNGTFFDDWGDWDRVTAGVTLSVTDGRWAAAYLQSRSDIEPSRIACMGYSLGSYIGCILTDVEDAFAGLVMNVGGTNTAAEQQIKDTYGMLVWALYAGGYFPTTHAPDISPRPAWMLNGLDDTVITPENAQALYEALQQPKKITWYDAGHILPTPASTGEAVGCFQNLFASPDDLDLDGLPNEDEMSIYGTGPLEEDSDGDGLPDGDEVNLHGSDPLSTDTDTDDLTDYEEVAVYGTEPGDPDTDGDGYSDYIEANCGADPADIAVNFQPPSSAAPAGSCPDGGGAYSPRGFGWL
jgi:dienelactone hydrolase